MLEDLYKVEGKAELVNGEIVEMPPAGLVFGIFWVQKLLYVNGIIFSHLRAFITTRRPRIGWSTTPSLQAPCQSRQARSYRSTRQRGRTYLPTFIHAMEGDRERCLEAGMDGYLSKPFHAAELFAAIERVLRW
jgi:hypothetical protein